MRTLALVTCLLLPTPAAAAQETTPVAEVFGGLSILGANGESLGGWLASGSATVVRWLGVEAEVGSNGDHIAAAVGPRFTARAGLVTAYAHGLVGTERRHGDYTFSVEGGGGMDVWVMRTLAVRAGLDGRGGWWEEQRFGTWRLQIGLVFALGTR